MKSMWVILALLAFTSAVAAQDTNAVISPANAAEIHEVARTGQGLIKDMALAADESQLAVATMDRVYLYDLETPDSPPAVLEMQGEALTVLEYAPSASLLAVGTESGKVYLWSLPENRISGMLDTQIFAVTQLLFLTDPSRLVVGSNEETASVWSIATLTRSDVLDGHPGGVVAMTLIDNGKRLLTAGLQTVNIWDTKSLTLQSANPGALRIRAMASNPARPAQIALQNSYDLILDSDLDSQEAVIGLTLEEPIQHLAFSPDGLWLAAAINEIVELRNPDTGDVIRTLYSGGHVDSLAFSPDGARLYSGSDSAIIIWDTKTGDAQSVLSDTFGLSRNLSFSPDGTLLAAGNYTNGTINIYDASTLALIRTLSHAQHGSSVSGKAVRAVTFSPDGRTLASAGSVDNSSIILWDVESGEAIHTLRGYKAPVLDLSFSPDGTMLLSVAASDLAEIKDNTARLWDVATGEMIREWEPQGGENVYAGVFLPDGINLMTAGYDNFVRIWEIESGEMLAEIETKFTPHDLVVNAQETYFVYSSLGKGGRFTTLTSTADFTAPVGYVSAISAGAVFNPTGDILAVETNEKDILLYDLDAQVTVATITGHTDTVFTLVFSPDGTRLASASADGTVRLWAVTKEN